MALELHLTLGGKVAVITLIVRSPMEWPYSLFVGFGV